MMSRDNSPWNIKFIEFFKIFLLARGRYILVNALVLMYWICIKSMFCIWRSIYLFELVDYFFFFHIRATDFERDIFKPPTEIIFSWDSLCVPNKFCFLYLPATVLSPLHPLHKLCSSSALLCSHKIKRRLLLGRKTVTNLDSVLKSIGITLPTKIYIVKAMVFPVVMYGYERWTRKKAERWQIDAFEMWCWRRLLRVPWTAKRSVKPVCPKGNQPWIFIGRTDAEAEALILWRCFYRIGVTAYFCLNLPSFWRCWSQEHSLISLFPGPPWWLRGKESACLMRETRVRSLIWEDVTCRRATKPRVIGLVL